MSWRRVWAVSRKEFIHVWRDPRSLGMALAIPLLLLFLFGYALTLDVRDIATAVYDQNRTPLSRDYISRFSRSGYFLVIHHVESYREIQDLVDSGKVAVGLVIPKEFSRDLLRGRATQVQALLDGSDSNRGTITQGYIEAISMLFAQQWLVRTIERLGVKEMEAPIDARVRVWFNEELESRNFIIPGLMAVILMMIAASLTSLTVAREWERGTMEQLISTPIRAAELILGKFVPYFAIGMVDALMCVAMATWLFGIPPKGSPILLIFLSAWFLMVALGLGLLISIRARNLLLANQVAMITSFLPSFLLSGFIWAIANMPTAVQWITAVVPARYFIHIIKGVYIKGVGLEAVLGSALVLGFMGGTVFLLGIRSFRRTVE